MSKNQKIKQVVYDELGNQYALEKKISDNEFVVTELFEGELFQEVYNEPPISNMIEGKQIVLNCIYKNPPIRKYDELCGKIKSAERKLEQLNKEINLKEVELEELKNSDISEILKRRMKEYKNLDILIDYIAGKYPVFEVSQFGDVIEKNEEIIGYNVKYQEVFLLKSYNFGESYTRINLAKPIMYHDIDEAEKRAIEILKENPYKLNSISKIKKTEELYKKHNEKFTDEQKTAIQYHFNKCKENINHNIKKYEENIEKEKTVLCEYENFFKRNELC
ncbi:hypothetical protein [Candidatus Ruminimicrobiellum ovillum]|uniref:hypothetical protein n=1 Tax=Candidatus Ruminimicrobiellum ovillum TaxID=1947927 RepID=UPI00355A2EAF